MADGTTLTFAGGDGQIDIAVQTSIAGQSVDLGNTGFTPQDFPKSPIASGNYTCAGDTLTYWPSIPGVEVSPIIFKRKY